MRIYCSIFSKCVSMHLCVFLCVCDRKIIEKNWVGDGY